MMGRVGPSLAWLGEARETLKRLPHLDAMQPIIVVCGAPNVGKSALIGALSTGTMEVNHYPFTTKQLHVGTLHPPALVPSDAGHTWVARPSDGRPQRHRTAGHRCLGARGLGGACSSTTPAVNAGRLDRGATPPASRKSRRCCPARHLEVITSKADLLDPLPSAWDEVKDGRTGRMA